MKIFTPIAIAILSLSLINTVGANAEPGEIGVRDNNVRWEYALNKGDTSSLTDLYTEDAIVMAPSLEIVSSKADIKDFWSSQINLGTEDFQVENVYIRVDGDTAYQSAIWVATLNINGISSIIDGEMTNVMERQADGKWKIRLQSWN